MQALMEKREHTIRAAAGYGYEARVLLARAGRKPSSILLCPLESLGLFIVTTLAMKALTRPLVCMYDMYNYEHCVCCCMAP